MDTLNDDCILYICKFLNTQEKIQLLSTCKRFYNLIEFKNDVVVYNKQTKKWVKKYKSKIEIQSLKTGLTKVHRINLSDKQLSSFNTRIIYNELDLSVNYLKIWPNLSNNIIWLDLSHNKLWNCCIANNNMNQLQHLNLENNCIKYISPEIENLQHLKYLNLAWNQIKNIPKCNTKRK